MRPSILYVEHPKNGTCGVFQHNLPSTDVALWRNKPMLPVMSMTGNIRTPSASGSLQEMSSTLLP
jgi:hypothetical protein